MAQLNAGIDWSGIRAAAIALNSVRAAADRAGANLPEDERRRFVERVNKRAYRERWLEDARALSTTAPTNAKPLSKAVQTGANSLALRLEEDSNETKIGFSTAARKVASKVATMPPSLDKDRAQAVRHWAGVASSVHGWDAKTGDDRGTVINIGILTQ
jgi:DNA-binding PucR family transcriptional regulator